MLERGKMDRDLVEFVVIDQLVPEETPHFSTVSYNFRHRFTEETVDRVFAWILDEVAKAGYLSPKAVFIICKKDTHCRHYMI